MGCLFVCLFVFVVVVVVVWLFCFVFLPCALLKPEWLFELLYRLIFLSMNVQLDSILVVV